MLGFPLGILSAAGAEVEGATYELIESEILAATASSVVFSSLATYASAYKHLQIRITARTNRAANTDFMKIRLNGDTDTNYAQHNLGGNGSTVTSTGQASQDGINVQRFSSNDAPASAFGAVVIDVLDAYSSTKNKTLRALGGASEESLGLSSGVFLSTASLTELSFDPGSGTLFQVGSRFSIYGIRG